MSATIFNKVLVTGGSGFIALHIVNELLERGYEVHTTTRNLKSERSQPLKQLQQKYSDRLQLFEADLLQPNSFLDAMTGVDIVVHTATPIVQVSKNPYEEMVKPAVEGTKNVLETCLLVNTVKVIVVTSSMAAVSNASPELNKLYSVDDFNPTTLEASPYAYAKVQAEKFVWEFELKHTGRFRIATINPTYVLGPYLQQVVEQGKFSLDDVSKDNVGLQFIKAWLKEGTQSLPKIGCNFVDVRDVALAHIKAIEIEAARGRFLLVANSLTWIQFKQYVAKFSKLSEEQFLSDTTSRGNGVIAKVDTSSATDVLGIKFITPEVSLRDMFDQLVEFS